MSKKLMSSWLVEPYIFYTSKGIQKTNILFAIFDDVEVAWYLYDENSAEYNNAEAQDVSNNSNDYAKQSYSRFAGKTSAGQGFWPKKVTRVGEFANGDLNQGAKALARFSLHRINDKRIKIYMNIYLKTGPQLVEFAPAESENPMDLPANYEWGQVSLLKVEKITSRFYSSSKNRIRDLGIPLRLYHPKPHAK